jgi:malonyl-ACP O-methyltransferase BioC
MNHSFKNTALHAPGEPSTVFLPGWGFDGSILHLLKPLPAWICPEEPLDPETIEKDLLELIDTKNIGKVRIIGWSMGAMLGLEFAARNKDLVHSLILVSLRPRWPDHEMNEIRAEFFQRPEPFLKKFYRKCFLGDRQAYRKFCTTLEPVYLAALKTNSERLQRGLDYLGEFKIPNVLPNIATRIIHGKQDILAPVAEIPLFPGAVVEIIDNAGHAVFLHEESSLQQELRRQAIQAKFSRAAASYDSYAKVQSEVARMLAAKLSPDQEKPRTRSILEIGCGTGNFTSLLAHRFPEAKILALDFSAEMIAKARQKLKAAAIEFVCAEGEQFLGETPAGSFDLVASNGSMQWFSNMDKTLSDIARILSPHGRFVCSIFGPGSLAELAAGLQAILGPGEGLAAEAFPSQETLWTALSKYYKVRKIEQELFEKTYRSTYDLLLHIKKTGTAGWQQKFEHPLTPSRVARLDAWFKRNYGACRVTYQILFLQGSP